MGQAGDGALGVDRWRTLPDPRRERIHVVVVDDDDDDAKGGFALGHPAEKTHGGPLAGQLETKEALVWDGWAPPESDCAATEARGVDFQEVSINSQHT